MRHFALRLTLVIAMTSAGLTFLRTAHADEVRYAGDYLLTVSFEKSPVVASEANGLSVRVQTATGGPVSNLDAKLAVQIGIPNQVTETLPLTAKPDQPGVYRVDLLLPRATTYKMNVVGTVNGQKIDEKLFSGQGGLERVISAGRVYPRGSNWAVVVTFGAYLVGLAVFGIIWLKRRARRTSPAAA